MVVGGIWSLIKLFKPLMEGINASLNALKNQNASIDLPTEEQDMPINYVGIGLVALLIPVFLLYNGIIEYLGFDDKNNELTQLNLDRSEAVKEFYSSAKDYYRLSLDYDENSSTITKEYKKKMRKDIRKIDEQIIPTLEGMLK